MLRIGFALLALGIFGCGNDNAKEETSDAGFSYANLNRRFQQVSVPYQLSDTTLLNNKDTTAIRYAEFVNSLDSAKAAVFGNEKITYSPLASIKGSKGEVYLVVKASGRNKKAAYIVVYNKETFGSVLPFLIPDNEPRTAQVSTIDRSFSIIKTVTKKDDEGVLADRREVFAYNADSKSFTLVLTDLFDDSNVELINPIDTLPKTHKYAGDYYLDKKSLVSVRNGRNENMLNVFIHISKNGGACTGELKGEVLLKENGAAFRQSGNPCVLQLKFTNNSVTLKEESGCGSSRGIDCLFDGTYTKKKLDKTKTSAKEK